MEISRDKKLYAASITGNIESLNQLLKEDKSILESYGTSTELCFKETPLHIAASQGHVEFAKVLLQNKPDLVNKLDSRLRSPLHLASINNEEEMVKLLLSVDSDACLIEDEFGMTPLHLAAMVKGKVEVVNQLIAARPEAIMYPLNRMKTITSLHMFVIRNGRKAIQQILVKVDSFLNSQDGEGNTILHKVVALKQLETLEYLVTRKELNVGLKNLDNFTAFDIIKQMPVDSNTTKMHKLLKIARDTASGSQANFTIDTKNWVEGKRNWVEEKRNALLVCATLIATIAYQAALSPPGGVWDNFEYSYTNLEGEEVLAVAGTSMFASNSPKAYIRFWIFNTLSFVGALSLIILLTSSPPQFEKMRVRLMLLKVYMWFLTFVIWMTLTAVAITYIYAMYGTVPFSNKDQPKPFDFKKSQPTDDAAYIITFALLAWFGFLGIVFLVIVCRVFVFIGKKLVKRIKRILRSVNGGDMQNLNDANNSLNTV